MASTVSSAKFGNAGSETKEVSATAFWTELEKGRFGYMPMILLAIGILGGIAASFALQMGVLALFSVVLPTMVCFCFMLAVMPMRMIFSTAMLAIGIDIILIFVGTFL